MPSRQATATLPPPRKPKVIPAADGAVSSDGRLARGERTRLRLAEALISLLNDGTPQPTAKAVAARAGVSLRLVFHHFEDIDAIYRAVIAVQAQRYWDHLKPIAPSLPLAERAERTARRRGRLYDAVAPVRRTSATLAPQSPDVAEWVATTNALLRSHITVTFAPELERAGSDRDDLLDALDVSASWEVWERLRSGQRLSRSAAQCVMARLLLDLLAPVAR